MGMRYLHVSFDDVHALGDRPALYLAYLRFRSKYADSSGFTVCSVAQIEKDIGYKRRIQDSCRTALLNKNYIECSSSNGKMGYKVKNSANVVK